MTPHPQWICKQCNDHCIAGCQFPVVRKPDSCLYTMNGKPLENAVWQQYESRRTPAPASATIIGKQTHEAFEDAKFPVFVQGTGWITKIDAERMFAETAARKAREQVLPFLEELASQSVSDARKREIIESLQAQQAGDP